MSDEHEDQISDVFRVPRPSAGFLRWMTRLFAGPTREQVARARIVELEQLAGEWSDEERATLLELHRKGLGDASIGDILRRAPAQVTAKLQLEAMGFAKAAAMGERR